MRTSHHAGRVAWLIVAAVGAAVWVAWRILSLRHDFLGAALRSEPFIRCGLIAAACALALVMLVMLMVRRGMRARGRSLLRDTGGSVMMEFTLLLPVAVVVSLIMIQAMLMMTATILVNYAAFNAARAAIVWIPQDLSGNVPQDYVAEPANVLADEQVASRKFEMIRLAAAETLLPIAGTSTASNAKNTQAIVDGIRKQYEKSGNGVPNWVDQLTGDQFNYAWSYTTVRFVNWDSAGGAVKERADVMIKVSHDFQLTVPWVAYLFGTSTDHGVVSPLEATCVLTNEGISDAIPEDSFTQP
ncbi:MAG: hypothetical protein BIFFINMI_02441 [Phycisphaerae bacterium]|nr:hypothetical protein [Phycisphaerae bacterium]